MSGQIHISQMVILAAGKGTRIRGRSQPLPKPLVRCGGLTLLKRSILTAKRCGVRRFVIVVGCDGEQVRAGIEGDPELAGLELVWVDNPDYELSNGVSVLRAREHIRGEFFLTMADHITDPAIFRTLQSTPAHGGLVLAVDRKLGTIFDMEDATKVRVDDRDRITDIGKHLTRFDAVDTGVFRCSPALFDALQAVRDETGDASLSHGVTQLAERGRARTADVGDAWWQDVDNLETRKHGEKLLFASLTKAIDGPVSRHVNRRFSKRVTRLLMNTPVVPNHMTAVGLIVGLAAAFVTALAHPGALWLLAVGGVLYQLSSMRWANLQAGAWADGVSWEVEGEAADGSIAHAGPWLVLMDLDEDGDGYPASADCDDGDDAVHPGATDDSVDGVDQDCDGVDGPPEITLEAAAFCAAGGAVAGGDLTGVLCTAPLDPATAQADDGDLVWLPGPIYPLAD